MRVNCFLDQTDLCKSKHTKNVYLSKTEGFKKERNTKKQILLESKPKKKYLYGKLLTIFTMNFISILFLYKQKVCVENAAKQKKKHKTTLY